MAKKPASDKPKKAPAANLTRKRPSGPKGGAPVIEIDLKALESMVEIQCTQDECCSILGVTEPTLDKRLKEAGYAGFLDFYKKHSENGKKSLRRAQWEAAVEDKNATMLVWLGKQVLGQKDKTEVEVTGNFAALLAERRKKRSDAG